MTNEIAVCILEKVKETAMKRRSSLKEAHRELPEGERRVWNLGEYILELRTEHDSRLRRNGTRYCAQ